jgi:hypothetical protein
MSGLTSELALGTAVGGDDTANYLTITLASALNTIDGEFSSTTGHNHNGAHQGGALVFGVLSTTSIQFANGATLGPFATGTTLRFQSINVTHSGNISADGNATITGTLGVTGATALGALNATNVGFSGTLAVTGVATFNNTVNATAALNVSGALGVTGVLTAASTLSATDLTATTGWHRNNTPGTGLINQNLGIGLRFDSGRAGPIMHGGAYDGARVHGTPHVRVGYFTTPAVANAAETTVGVTFTPAFPSTASPATMLTLLRNSGDHTQWRINVEFGTSTYTGFTARVRNETGNTEGVSVAYLAYWNE